ncbi:MAG: NAD-dependent epimerase/dehydratase family protein [Phycisphaerales bacterium]|nr:MAG: NAD-dependent epimerase/dehydratase family protein [Phycisphaerales bacterium]
MRKPATLVTGASGEVGQGLIDAYAARGDGEIIALDLRPLDAGLAARCGATIAGDILDENLLQRLVSEYEIQAIYHLAALLSTRAEYTPDTAHRVNVNGTLNLLKLAHEQARWHGRTVVFNFPSSIAVYGLPDLATKIKAGRVSEDEHNVPTTMYGCNKLYCEHLGRYFTRHYRQLAADRTPSGVDFRSVRFPGLISAFTLPSGGTSDYAAEMIHAAAEGKPYACFVSRDARIPFMAMPDAIKALTQLAHAPASSLSRRVYNVGAFSLSAAELQDRVLAAFHGARITFEPDLQRAAIVDTWPEDVDDSAARADWGWKPDFDADRAFEEYLLPNIRGFYRGKERPCDAAEPG